jgi:hypothetical protein
MKQAKAVTVTASYRNFRFFSYVSLRGGNPEVTVTNGYGYPEAGEKDTRLVYARRLEGWGRGAPKAPESAQTDRVSVESQGYPVGNSAVPHTLLGSLGSVGKSARVRDVCKQAQNGPVILECPKCRQRVIVHVPAGAHCLPCGRRMRRIKRESRTS